MDSIFTVLPVLLLIVIAIILIVSNIKIVPQAHAYVIERLGAYKGHGRWDFILKFLLSTRSPKRYL